MTAAAKKVRHKDGAAHFSHLKHFDDSPAHYKVACEAPEDDKPAAHLVMGHAVHRELFGDRPGTMTVVWEGKNRSGKAWTSFKKEYGKLAKSKKLELDIMPIATATKAKTIADAVRKDPKSARLLGGASRFEVPMRWTDPATGIECATGGIDILNLDAAFAADLKTTTNAEPEHFIEHAWTMRYHAQAGMNFEGCEVLGRKLRNVYCIAVEVDPPYAVTVLDYGLPLIAIPDVDREDLLEEGRRTFRTWLERLKACEESGVFPTYNDAPVPWRIPDRVLARIASSYQSRVDFSEDERIPA